MNYEVREILKNRQLIAWGVFKFDAPKKAAPVHEFSIGSAPDGSRVAHYLACAMANDMNAGVE